MSSRLTFKPPSLFKSAIAVSLALILILLSACSGTKRLEINDSFPVPLMQKTPVNLGIYLDAELLAYVHKETIDRKGTWEVAVGPAQESLFNNLAMGVFTGHTFVDGLTVKEPLDGVLKPTIQEVQFSLPEQTRSEYYEVWIRYEFALFDRAGTQIGTWKLPAYGKAKQDDHGSSSNGLQAAALAACRDAMAFFSINFEREPSVQQWLAAGKPLMAIPAVSQPSSPMATKAEPSTKSSDDDANQESGRDSNKESQSIPKAASSPDKPTAKSASLIGKQV